MHICVTYSIIQIKVVLDKYCTFNSTSLEKQKLYSNAINNKLD